MRTDDEQTSLRKRREATPERWIPGDDYDETLPYGGKVVMARRKKPQSSLWKAFQVASVVCCLGFAYYIYYYFHHFHFHLTHTYARLGHIEAQHLVANKYLKGHGTKRNRTLAMQWYKEAADNGHPHAAHNLAVGRLKGYHDLIEKHHVSKYLKHARENGVKEAQRVWDHLCERGLCDDNEVEEPVEDFQY